MLVEEQELAKARAATLAALAVAEQAAVFDDRSGSCYLRIAATHQNGYRVELRVFVE